MLTLHALEQLDRLMKIATAGLRGPANGRLSLVLKARSPSWRLVTRQQEAHSVHPTYGCRLLDFPLPGTPGQPASHPPDKIAAEDETQHEDEDARAKDDHVDVEGKVLETDGGHGAGLVGAHQSQATETPCGEQGRASVMMVGNLLPRLETLCVSKDLRNGKPLTQGLTFF